MYSVIIEIFDFCARSRRLKHGFRCVAAYRGPFLLHYLDAVVYPNIPPNLLIAGAVAVCVLNLWILRPACPCPTFTRMKKRPRCGVRTGDVRASRDYGFCGAFSSESLVFIKLEM